MAGDTITNHNRRVNIFAYPRSGSTFLQSVLDYVFPDVYFDSPRHTVWEIKDDIAKGNKPIVTFRNPVDSISSWNVYRNEGHVGLTHMNPEKDSYVADIKFYIRIYTAILDHIDDVLLMPFAKFCDNIDYITDTVSLGLGLEPKGNPSLEFVKKAMKDDSRVLNLPRETKPIIENVKPLILEHPLYSDTLGLYQRLTEASEK